MNLSEVFKTYRANLAAKQDEDEDRIREERRMEKAMKKEMEMKQYMSEGYPVSNASMRGTMTGLTTMGSQEGFGRRIGDLNH